MKKHFRSYLCVALLSLFCFSLSARTLYVDCQRGSSANNGSLEHPFLTISQAAQLAIAGDTIVIRQGVYREWVSPENGGINPFRRIVYMAAEGEKVELKGSEMVTNWKRSKDGLWSVEVDNKIFGDFNPFAINLKGDWLSQGQQLHLGSLYIDGQELIEAITLEDMTGNDMRWRATVGDETTVITAKFAGADPNKSLTEINARPTCFFPKHTGVNYITVKGITISQAATQWSPPTSAQIGIIGPNWSKGWIIEECDISYSKCVGICLGKEKATGHNMWSLYKNKYGYMKCGFNREIEAILKARTLGWAEESVGSHLIKNNKIYECGQAGIVGHLGSIFSTITGNEIYNINRNPQIKGAEAAGIKLHAAIDVLIENNCITNTVMGVWLDWQAQGTQVCGNLIAQSEQQDIFVEVSHGPTMIYNNILLSDLNVVFTAQGIALFNNLLSGRARAGASPERYTPYHYPHSTDVMGLFNNLGGDDRFYNNLHFANAPQDESSKGKNGLEDFNRYPRYSDDFGKDIKQTPQYLAVRFPIWTGCNLHFKGSVPYNKEEMVNDHTDSQAKVALIKESDGYYINLEVDPNIISEATTCRIDTEMLGQTFIAEALFENPDKSPFLLNKDFFNSPRDVDSPTAGPFENFESGKIKVWPL